jgi:hypothetical protein
VSSDPPDGHAAHALLNAALVPRVRAIGPRIDAIVDELLAGIDGRREIDLVAEFAHALPIRVIAELLDIPEAERTRFQALSRTIARGMDRLYGSDDVSSGLREIGAYFLGLVTERAGRTRAIDRAIGRWLRVTGCATCGWRGGSASKSIERGNFTCDRMLGDAGQARTLVASATRLARGRTHVGEAAVADPKGPDTGKD